MKQIEIENLPLAALRPNPRNARTHKARQIKQIAASIEAFGFANPIIIDEANLILCGHGRYAAAKRLGLTDVPCVRLTHLSPEQKRAYVIADNKLALKAGWDPEILAIELSELAALHIDPTLTAFEQAEIDIILDESAAKKSDAAKREDTHPGKSESVVTQRGDVWRLGPHRLICGDARDAGAYRALLNDEEAALVFTDPPYNVPIGGFVGGKGRVQHREFAMASGEMSQGEFVAFLKDTLGAAAAHSTDGSLHFVCMDWRHYGDLLAAAGDIYDEQKNLIVWVKDNGGMGTFYRSRHELIAVFKKGGAPHANNFELGQYGRSRTNVWEYAGVNSMKKNRLDELAMHPTVKPVAMVADALKDCSALGDIVLDPFGGSGTTLIAAHQTGRVARLIELDPLYCDVIVRRWEAFTGRHATLDDSAATFEEIEAAFAEPISQQKETS